MSDKRGSYNLDECRLSRTAEENLESEELNFTQLPKLYMTPPSPPVRAVLMVAHAINVPLQLVPLDLFHGEHLKPEFIEKNPQHTVPTLEENGFILWDSNAIAAYLVTAYAKNEDLYPREPRKRALIDQRLHFNSSILFVILRSIVRPLMLMKQTSIPEERQEELNEALGYLEKFLEGNEWLAGENLTIADICTVATVSSINEFSTIDEEKYPNVCRWFENCKQLECYEENMEGLNIFGNFVRGFLKE